MTVPHLVDTARLERRRRLAVRVAVGALLISVVCCPLGMAIGGTEARQTDTRDTVAGALLFASIIGLVVAPWVVRAWQGFMRRHMLAAIVAGRPDIRHIDGEHERPAREAALSSDAFDLGAFHNSGLVEAFTTAGVDHILTGTAEGVPFALAEISLLDAKGYRMFGGVLASFRLARARSGLTVVTRDKGMFGNLLARAGSGIHQLELEDPTFEGVFEVYGDDQVAGRVILTTTMLERLKALDDLAHARGFACAFVGAHLLVAFRGMHWRCAPWRVLQPLSAWLPAYAAWLGALVALPVEIVKTLDLRAPRDGALAVPVTRPAGAVPLDSASGQVFSSALWRLVGEGGMALVSIASGAIFGGVALLGAWYGVTAGYSDALFWYFWGLITAGVLYGAYAIALGVGQLARLAWRWDAPLRTLDRP